MNERVLSHVVVLALIATVGLLCYSNALQAPLLYDAHHAITANEAVHLNELSWPALWNAAFDRHGNRPVSQVSFALNYYVHGLDVFGYHVVNLLIHLASAMILYFWIYKTLRLPLFLSRYSENAALRIAAFSSLLWVVHPVQTQAVTYVVQRMTGLATLFYLAALLAYVFGRTGGRVARPMWFAASAISGLFALGSKEIAATLPVVILLYEVLFISRMDLTKIRKDIGVYSVLTVIIVLLAGVNIIDRGAGLLGEGYHPQSFTTAERLLTEGRVIVYYLSLLIFPLPSRLTIDYYFPLSHALFDPITTLLSWALILFLISGAIRIMRKAPLISFCILWFFINLAIESSFIMLDLVAEHRLYLPSAGAMLLAAIGIESVIEKEWISRTAFKKYAPIGGMVLVVIVFGFWTWERNGVWNDAKAIWGDAVNKYPENPRAHYNLGFSYLNSGRIDAGMGELERAVLLRPEYGSSKLTGKLYSYAFSNLKEGNYEQAGRILSGIIEISPDDAMSHRLLGTFLINQGDFQSAVNHLERSVLINKDDPETYNRLGLAYGNLGRTPEAVASFKKAISLSPSFVDAYQSLGDLYLGAKSFEEAAEVYQRALRIDPTRIKILVNLGYLYNLTGNDQQAINILMQAVQLDPNSPDAYNHLGVSYMKEGLLKQAVESFEKAIKIDPRLAEAHHHLGSAYRRIGSDELAARHLEKARRLDSKMD